MSAATCTSGTEYFIRLTLPSARSFVSRACGTSRSRRRIFTTEAPPLCRRAVQEMGYAQLDRMVGRPDEGHRRVPEYSDRDLSRQARQPGGPIAAKRCAQVRSPLASAWCVPARSPDLAVGERTRTALDEDQVLQAAGCARRHPALARCPLGHSPHDRHHAIRGDAGTA